MQRFLSILFVSSLVTSSAPAQHVMRTINGNAASDHFASSMIDAGDLNADGYRDLLVGAPGFNSARGKIYAISGRFLATGTQPSTLWSLSPPSLDAGDEFGRCLAAVGDINGDFVPDFVVGVPGYDSPGAANAGAIIVVDGSSHSSWVINDTYAGERFGFSMDVYGDWNGDGKLDLVVGAPGGTYGSICVISGTRLAIAGQLTTVLTSITSVADYGWSIASGFDVEGDGDNDILVGSPLSGASGEGRADLWLRDGNYLANGGSFASLTAGSYLGLSVDAKHDYDGDGFIDLVVGAPYTGPNDKGRVVVLSGAEIIAGSSTPLLFGWVPGATDTYFGSAVCASNDLNGDGVGDILVGGPGYATNDIGRLWIYSGATGEYVGSIVGSGQDRLGDALLGAFDDLDGDGYPEFVVAGPFSDSTANDAGLLKCVTLFPVHASSYCTGKQNSLGCTPGISAASGYASASSTSTYVITGFDFLNKKSGLLFYGYDANDAPFQGGTLCVKAPLVRTALQNSGGPISGSSCTGVYSFDFNAHIQSGLDPNLVVGRQVFCQYWARDPQSASTTSLSDALRVFVNP